MMIDLRLKIPPLIVMLLAGMLGWLLAEYVPLGEQVLPGAKIVSMTLVSLGGLCALAGVIAFRSARTTVDPRYPDQTSALVQSGIYQRTRNPMYLGFLLALFGYVYFLNTLTSFLVIPLFILYLNQYQIRPEEKILIGLFGDAYKDYMKDVRRWL